MAIKFNLKNFPKYREEHQDDVYSTWIESLQSNGYPSTKNIGMWEFEMDDFEYTHFVLKWSS